MTRSEPSGAGTVPRPLVLAALAAVPGAYVGAATYVGLPAPELPEPVAALVYGTAIVGAAFILAWAAEAAQVDISAGLALALLALLAVLPEYAVDFVFTWQCGTDGGDACSLALANMTGANRVLVGVGWPLVVLVAAIAVRRASRRGEGDGSSRSTDAGEVRLAPTMSVDIVFLGLATLYSLTLPLRTSLTLWDAAVYVTLFGLYARRLATASRGEPDLLGTSRWIGEQDAARRRAWFVAMFVVGALIILLTAEHFANSLVASGKHLGIDEFLLVQWVAPLASEAPELIVACLYAWRLKADDSLGTLLSSKVNQWSLLVGSLPLVYAASSFGVAGLPLDVHQRHELLITAAQSLFAVALLIDRRLDVRGATALLLLFGVQFVVSVMADQQTNRMVILVLSALYGLMALVYLVRRRDSLRGVLRDGATRPLAHVSDDPRE